MTGLQPSDEADVNQWLLADEGRRGDKRKQQQPQQVTPLPRLQIAVLLFFQLAEPITSQCIYPFINQVRVWSPLHIRRALSDAYPACE